MGPFKESSKSIYYRIQREITASCNTEKEDYLFSFPRFFPLDIQSFFTTTIISVRFTYSCFLLDQCIQFISM